MTENEAREFLGRFSLDRIGYASGKEVDTERFNYFTEVLMTAMQALTEIQQYRSIGTVEECRVAVEKQRAKKPIILSEQSAESEGKLYIAKYFKCPACGNASTYFGGLPNNCHNCGQSLESDTP